MVYAMQQFRYHLLACQFKLRTNHKTLQRLSVPVEDGGTPVQMIRLLHIKVTLFNATAIRTKMCSRKQPHLCDFL